jgi:hypothetical protein
MLRREVMEPSAGEFSGRQLHSLTSPPGALNNQGPHTPLCYNELLLGVAIDFPAEVVELADTPSEALNLVFSVTFAQSIK